MVHRTKHAPRQTAEWLPQEIVEHIATFLPLELHTLLIFEHLNFQCYSVAETCWQKLWHKEHPSASLTKNYRFASIQVSKYLNKFDKKEIKVLLAGTGGIGKSALVLRYTTDTFVPQFDPTIEDTYRKTVEIHGTKYTLDILDTAGQESYSALRDQYWRTSDCAILCCSLDSGYSIDDLYSNYEQLLRCRDTDEFPVVISLNKSDLGTKDMEVAMETVNKVAKQLRISHVTATSALNGSNINEVFESVVMCTIDNVFGRPELIEKLENGVPLNEQEQSPWKFSPKKKKCSMM